MQNSYQKDIQTLEEYSHMLCDDTLINHFSCHSTPRKDALKLFPKDEVSELAYEIQNSNYISKDAIEFYSQALKTSKKLIVKSLQQNSISITDNKYSFNISNMDEFDKNLQNIIDDLENRISPRGVST